jgi:hypothetical protein
VEAPGLQRSKAQIPFPVVDLDEADHFAAEHVADVDPLRLPADPAVGADDARLEVRGVLEGRGAPESGAGREAAEVPSGGPLLERRVERRLVRAPARGPAADAPVVRRTRRSSDTAGSIDARNKAPGLAIAKMRVACIRQAEHLLQDRIDSRSLDASLANERAGAAVAFDN